MDNRPTSEYAQPGSHHHPPTDASSEQKPAEPTAAAHYTPQSDVQSANISSHTSHSDYGLNPPSTRSPYPEYHPLRAPAYAPNSQPGGGAGMAQATNPSLPANSPTYPPPYSPYHPQGHEMPQYQGQPPPNQYGRHDWPPHNYGAPGPYPQGPYASPSTTVGSASPTVSAKSRPGQVYSFVPIPGSAQHKRPRRRYEEIERMYKCGWNGCEKAYGTLNHLNAHVTMQSHGAKRTPEEFKEIRKEWKARKKDEEAHRKAAEERERAAAAVQASNHQVGGVDAANPSDPSHQSHGQPSYPGVRPQLPPIGYQPADGQVHGQYGGPGGGMVYPGNGQMSSNGQMYSANYPHSPYPNGQGQFPPRE